MVLVAGAIIVLACVPGGRGAPRPKIWINKPVKALDLTLRQQIAQLIMVRVEGHYYSADNGYYRDVERWVTEDQVGGLITYRGSVDGTFTNLQHFQRLAPIPLVIASDLERGTGQQIRGGTAFPSNMAVAATYDEGNAYQQGRITALEARVLGIHITFAPVMDVNNNPDNPIINFRAYSDDPDMVARMGSAFIRGAQENGLITAAKHYPGHGNTSMDSHLSDLPVIPGDREALEAMELAPFKAAIEAGVKMVMVGHLVVPGLDDSNRPAVHSPIITQKVLREELGFQGIIVPDALEMASITNGSWAGESAIRAIEAGNDIIFLPVNVRPTIDAIERAVQNGRLTRERIETSVERILRLKAELGIYKERQKLAREKIPSKVGLAKSASLAREIARKSITLVKDDSNLIPLKPTRNETLTHFVLSMDDELKERTGPFWRNVKGTYGNSRVKTIFLNDELNKSRINNLVGEAQSTTQTLVTLLVRIYGGKGETSIDSTHQELLIALDKAGIKYVVVSFGDPYLPSLAPISTYLPGYSYAKVTMRAMADAIFGRAPITGRLPVTLGKQYPRGHGLERSSLTSTFLPAEHPVDLARAWAVLDSAVAYQITPGAQVFIAQAGRVLADSGVGYHTYDRAVPVTRNSIYDLASVTKVLVGGTVGLKLVENRYMVLDEPVAHYFPEFIGRWKDQATIRHLLTHSSGLPPFKQYWKLGLSSGEVLDDILATELEFEPGSDYLYSDLGMILFTALAEKTTGRPFEDLAREWVFIPLQAKQMTYNPPAELYPRIVPTEVDAEGRQGLIHGTVHDGNTWFLGGVSSHAGVFAPAHQLAVLGQMYLDGGILLGTRLFKAETLDLFTQPQELPPGSGRALFWWMASSTAHSGDLLSSTAFGHTGYTGTSIWIDPELDLVVVLLTNRVHPTRENSRIKGIRRAFHNEVVKALDRIPLAGN